MNEIEAVVFNKLKEREQCMLEVLYLTEQASVRDDEVDAYVELMSKRQQYFEKIYEIDDYLVKNNFDRLLNESSSDFSREANNVNNNAKAIAYKIVELDKANEEVVKRMYDKFKGDFKTVNNGKSMRNLYSNYDLHSGYYFDKKK